MITFREIRFADVSLGMEFKESPDQDRCWYLKTERGVALRRNDGSDILNPFQPYEMVWVHEDDFARVVATRNATPMKEILFRDLPVDAAFKPLPLMDSWMVKTGEGTATARVENHEFNPAVSPDARIWVSEKDLVPRGEVAL